LRWPTAACRRQPPPIGEVLQESDEDEERMDSNKEMMQM